MGDDLRLALMHMSLQRWRARSGRRIGGPPGAFAGGLRAIPLSVAVVVALGGAPRNAAAQAPAPPLPATDRFEEPLFSGAALVHDNDNFPHPGNTLLDDNYSAAYELRVNGRLVDRLGLTAPLDGFDWLSRVQRRHAAGARRFHSAQLIGVIYTPDRIDTAEVQTDDRPYASLIALTVGRTSVGGPALDRAWSSDLSIGMLGMDAPGDVQRLIHRTRRWMTGRQLPVDPQGWDNQISAGGEPTALYRVGYQRRLAGSRPRGPRQHWEVVGGTEGSVGYHTTAAASLSARLGAFTSRFWEFPRGPSSPAVGQQERLPGRRWDLFGFAVLRPRVVLYNALVQGQFRHSVHTVRPRHLLAEWEGGLAGSLPLGSLQLQIVAQFAQGRSADYVGPKARAYTWGTVGFFLSRSRR
ncbi:MAG: lipid A-modifier LpxR family protein [Vicinamibacterales bacterium]